MSEFNMKDLSPGALLSAVTTGEGFTNPRLVALAAAGLGVLLAAGNFVLIFVLNRYYPYLLGVAPILVLGGVFMLATGEPKFRGEGQTAPMWTRAGLAGSMILGLAIGAALVFLVHWGP
ncbi:MAG: hypothetical protein HYV09_38850 [Deltaproteobacteria bacterium]|nr:hypothetical protein [Deltaproteobacteria bacterium]